MFDFFSGEYDRFPLVGFPVTQKFAESNPNTVAALQRALAKGLNFAHNNPDKLRDIYPTFTTLQPELARKIVLSYTPEKSDFTQLKKIGDLMDRLQCCLARRSCRTLQRRNNERLAGRSAMREPALVNRDRWPVRTCASCRTAFRVVWHFRFLFDLGVRDKPWHLSRHLFAAGLDGHPPHGRAAAGAEISQASLATLQAWASASPSRR